MALVRVISEIFMLTDNSSEEPKDIGVLAIEVYFPKKVLDCCLLLHY